MSKCKRGFSSCENLVNNINPDVNGTEQLNTLKLKLKKVVQLNSF